MERECPIICIAKPNMRKIKPHLRRLNLPVPSLILSNSSSVKLALRVRCLSLAMIYSSYNTINAPTKSTNNPAIIIDSSNTN